MNCPTSLLRKIVVLSNSSSSSKRTSTVAAVAASAMSTRGGTSTGIGGGLPCGKSHHYHVSRTGTTATIGVGGGGIARTNKPPRKHQLKMCFSVSSSSSTTTVTAAPMINHRETKIATTRKQMSTSSAKTSPTESGSSSSSDPNKKRHQHLYMWGTGQYGTILNPSNQTTDLESTTTLTTTTTTTSTTSSSSTSEKYDIPTLMDATTWNSSNAGADSRIISKVICGPTETAIVFQNGMCFVSGKNEYGQLGFGHCKPIPAGGKNGMTSINANFDSIDNNDNGNSNETMTATATKIRHVAFGTNFAAYLVDPPSPPPQSPSPQNVVATTTTTTTATTTTTTTEGCYDLYTCGFGGSTLSGVGCLGHGTIDSTTRPKLVESLYEDNIYVRDVVAGDGHCTILTSEYEILTTGSGSYGRLGNFDTTDQMYFEPVEIELPTSTTSSPPPHIHQIAGGKSFTLALSTDGSIYGWGRNHKGQLGTGLGLAVDMYAMQSVPESITDTSDLLLNVNIVKIAAGHSHAACISDTGEVYFWGMTLHLEPVLVESLLHTKIVDITCGHDYTFAIDIHGHMYSFGNGNYVLGHGKDIRQLTEAKRIETFQTGIQEQTINDGNTIKMIQRKIIHAAAGWKHAAVLLEEEHIDKPKDYATIIQ